MTHGIKIAKPGKSVHSTDLRDLSVDLNTFSMFKLHSTSTTSVTLNGGDSEKSSTVSHSLGYVPAFLVYYKRSDESVERLIPDIPYGVDFDFYPWAYATTSGITVGYSCKDPFNQLAITTPNGQIHEDFWYEDGGFGLIVGKVITGSYSSAVRFSGVALNRDESIVSANLEFLNVVSGSTNADTKYTVYGLDYDDMGDSFDSGGNKTDARDDRTQSQVGGTWNFSTDVLDQVREIIARSGWSSGNHMAFSINDNGTVDTNTYIGDSTSTTGKLTVVKSGSLTVSFRVVIFKDKIAD